jgi:hypothetical protein
LFASVGRVFEDAPDHQTLVTLIGMNFGVARSR